MDNRAGEMETFVQAARRGSFAAAAKAMQLSPSAVSRSIGRLEARLGVRLFQRTTRALNLTAEGEAYLSRASELLSEIEEIERSLTAEAAEPRGKIRVNASVPFGTYCIVPVLPQFLETYPKVTVDLSLSDAVVDLIEERADIAIRIGALLKAAGLAPSGSEAMRKLGERAVRVDGAIVEARDLSFSAGGEHLLQLGKRGFARVRLIAPG